jgi:hypothetical protein
MTNSLTTMEMQYNNRLAKTTFLQEPAHGTPEHQVDARLRSWKEQRCREQE